MGLQPFENLLCPFLDFCRWTKHSTFLADVNRTYLSRPVIQFRKEEAMNGLIMGKIKLTDKRIFLQLCPIDIGHKRFRFIQRFLILYAQLVD